MSRGPSWTGEDFLVSEILNRERQPLLCLLVNARPTVTRTVLNGSVPHSEKGR